MRFVNRVCNYPFWFGLVYVISDSVHLIYYYFHLIVVIIGQKVLFCLKMSHCSMKYGIVNKK